MIQTCQAVLLMICSVSNYAVPTATLTLNHRYPVSAAVTSALVDVGLLLNTVKSNEIQVGEWVNVIGYITQSPVGVNQGRRKPDNTAVGGAACVQAIVLWSAGAIKLGEYEQVLEERHEVERRLLQT